MRKIGNGDPPCDSSPWGAWVDDRDISGYFGRQVIAVTSASDAAAVRPSSLYGSIPVSVRTVPVRKLLVGWDGKSGEPKFRQLEPHGHLAATIGRHPAQWPTSNDATTDIP